VSFNHHKLIARIGNEQGAREEFARLIAALAELTTRVRRIRENPGGWGIDAFAGRLDDGGEVAFDNGSPPSVLVTLHPWTRLGSAYMDAQT
jgi:hypothetical protein